MTLEYFFSFFKWIQHIKWIYWCENHTYTNVSKFKSHCYMPRIYFRHLSSHLLLKETPQKSQFPYGRFIHPPHFKTPKIHSCQSPIFHCLCSHHNRFIFHHYYLMTSHILSTYEFHVGPIFHYDSSQSFILYSYWMMWNSLRSTFQWSYAIDSDTSSRIDIRVL